MQELQGRKKVALVSEVSLLKLQSHEELKYTEYSTVIAVATSKICKKA